MGHVARTIIIRKTHIKELKDGPDRFAKLRVHPVTLGFSAKRLSPGQFGFNIVSLAIAKCIQSRL
jgi:hypothetical protein